MTERFLALLAGGICFGPPVGLNISHLGHVQTANSTALAQKVKKKSKRLMLTMVAVFKASLMIFTEGLTVGPSE